MDTTVIDTPEGIRKGDPEDMLGRIRELGTQVRDAWRIATGSQLPASLRGAKDITVLGMGGSAIGGELAGSLLLDALKVPMSVHRDYGLPAYVGKGSLVIASSYSGDTEETLSGFGAALERGASVMAITTGGKIAALSKERGLPLVTFSYKARPRATLGWSLGLVLGVLEQLGYSAGVGAQAERAQSELAAVDRSATESRAKALAKELAGKVPFFFGAGVMGVMARRAKDQWNENSKNWASYDVMSELNHNAVVGFPHPDAAREILRVVMLRSGRDNPRHALRFDVTAELLDRAKIEHTSLRFEGSSMLSEVLQMNSFLDHVSFYVALLNGADPSPNTSIDYLKERLAKGS